MLLSSSEHVGTRRRYIFTMFRHLMNKQLACLMNPAMALLLIEALTIGLLFAYLFDLVVRIAPPFEVGVQAM